MLFFIEIDTKRCNMFVKPSQSHFSRSISFMDELEIYKYGTSPLTWIKEATCKWLRKHVTKFENVKKCLSFYTSAYILKTYYTNNWWPYFFLKILHKTVQQSLYDEKMYSVHILEFQVSRLVPCRDLLFIHKGNATWKCDLDRFTNVFAVLCQF